MNELFEEFVRRNRSEFDRLEHVPGERMWQDIEFGLPTKTRRIRWARVAAAVLLAAVGVPGVILNLSDGGGAYSTDIQVADVYPEWADEEANYLKLIEQKKEELDRDEIDQYNHPGLLEQLDELELDFERSLKDLERNEDKDDILKILIKYHERQLSILERISRENEKRTKEEKIHEELLY